MILKKGPNQDLKLCALLILPLTYIYVCMGFDESETINYLFALFTLGFLGLGEYLYRDVKRSAESWLFMIMTLLSACSVTFTLGYVWDNFTVGFFTHLFAVYWVLCRSGKLYYQETSHLFLLDGISGFLLTPFGNYIKLFPALASFFKRTGKKGGEDGENGAKKRDAGQIIGIVIVSLFALALFVTAMKLLISADVNFKHLMKLPNLNWLKLDGTFVFKLIITAIIAPYLFGLFAGCYEKSVAMLRHSAEKIEQDLAGIKKIPAKLWIAFIVFFSVFYIIFILLQGSYMFSALQMILPKNYTFSGYARRGFAEMIGITFINFVLLWLATRTAEVEQKVKPCSILLVVETIVFILIASLKIFMYIQAYGWTQLRAQSIWLCGVLFFTCGCILYRLITGKDVVKFWFDLGALSLAIMTVC